MLSFMTPQDDNYATDLKPSPSTSKESPPLNPITNNPISPQIHSFYKVLKFFTIPSSLSKTRAIILPLLLSISTSLESTGELSNCNKFIPKQFLIILPPTKISSTLTTVCFSTLSLFSIAL